MVASRPSWLLRWLGWWEAWFCQRSERHPMGWRRLSPDPALTGKNKWPGIGAPADSTVMPSAPPWFLAVLGAPANIVSGVPDYRRLGRPATTGRS